MYAKGQTLKGWIYDEAGNEVEVQGTFEFRTDDPEEYIQDIVLRMPDGRLQYVDEQVVRSV